MFYSKLKVCNRQGNKAYRILLNQIKNLLSKTQELFIEKI